MAINCATCKEQLNTQLSVLPTSWREKIVEFVCSYLTDQQSSVDCDEVLECLEERTTELSEFTVDNGTVCIRFTNNEQVTVERCFSFTEIINETMNDLDPACLAEPEDWIDMTYQERWQSIIDKVCEDCSTTTTTMVPVNYECPYGECCTYSVHNTSDEAADVTYIDINGDPQTINIAEDEIEFFQGQDITSIPFTFQVTIAACTTTTTTTSSTTTTTTAAPLPEDCSNIVLIVGTAEGSTTTTTTV